MAVYLSQWVLCSFLCCTPAATMLTQKLFCFSLSLLLPLLLSLCLVLSLSTLCWVELYMSLCRAMRSEPRHQTLMLHIHSNLHSILHYNLFHVRLTKHILHRPSKLFLHFRFRSCVHVEYSDYELIRNERQSFVPLQHQHAAVELHLRHFGLKRLSNL